MSLCETAYMEELMSINEKDPAEEQDQRNEDDEFARLERESKLRHQLEPEEKSLGHQDNTNTSGTK